MTDADLADVAGWLETQRVARWWLADISAEAKLATYRDRVLDPGSPTTMLIVVVEGRPVGFCQSYRWGDYPQAAETVGAAPEEFGIDYAIGAAEVVGHGLGTQVVRALVDRVRRAHPGAGIVVDPAADNLASRRVLEKNDFQLARDAAPGSRAVYRLPAVT